MRVDNEQPPKLSELIHQLGVRVQELKRSSLPFGENTQVQLNAVLEFVEKVEPIAKAYEGALFPKLYLARQ